MPSAFQSRMTTDATIFSKQNHDHNPFLDCSPCSCQQPVIPGKNHVVLAICRMNFHNDNAPQKSKALIISQLISYRHRLL
mmetsp:Transcript_22931/g.54132  ORF Transcript_22931/g.54132 Transcript_22931/m.54132 type:complete len:80 (+) Transcript_22931:175-414(+)